MTTENTQDFTEEHRVNFPSVHFMVKKSLLFVKRFDCIGTTSPHVIFSSKTKIERSPDLKNKTMRRESRKSAQLICGFDCECVELINCRRVERRNADMREAVVYTVTSELER